MPKEKKTEMLTLRFTKTTRQGLDKVAAAADMNITEWIEERVKWTLRRIGDKK